MQSQARSNQNKFQNFYRTYWGNIKKALFFFFFFAKLHAEEIGMECWKPLCRESPNDIIELLGPALPEALEFLVV